MRACAKDNPRLIHCSILAFGRGGRYFNRPAYDPVIQSLSGVAGTIARATGEPRFVPMVMSDHTSGLIAAQCIGFALYRREKTGKGEAIDVPMLENMASFVSSEHLGAATFDPPVGPTGDGRLLSPELPAGADQGRLRHGAAQHQRARPSPSSTRSAGPSSRPIRASTARRRAPKNAAAYFEVPSDRPGAEDDGRMGRAVRQARRAGGALQLDRRPVDRSASRRMSASSRKRIIRAKAASAARKLANIFSGGAREKRDATRR